MTFDTLKYVETLREAGVDEKQAAAQAHALQDIVSDKVATKTQLEQVETALKTDIERVETVLEAKIDKLETKMQGEFSKIEAILKIVVGIGVAILVGIFTMVIKTLFFA